MLQLKFVAFIFSSSFEETISAFSIILERGGEHNSRGFPDPLHYSAFLRLSPTTVPFSLFSTKDRGAGSQI